MSIALLGLCLGADDGIHFSHNPTLVMLSFAAAALASYAALEMADRIPATDPSHRHAWRLGSVASLGTGIWSMHFIGMLAVTAPLPLEFEPGPTVLSLGMAVASAMLGFALVGPGRDRWYHVLPAGLVVGLGIACVHFIGMTGVQLGGVLSYRPALLGGSILIAIGAAVAALLLVHRLRPTHWLRALAALLMAGATCGMHYTAMAAATLAPTIAASAGGGAGRSLLAGVITASLGFLLLLALVAAAADRRLSAASTHEMEMLRSANTRLQQTQEEFLRRLATVVEHRDSGTGAHITRMGAMARQLALAAGCRPDYAEQLGLAAMLHDIGKVGVCDAILLKPGKFTPEERRQMQEHPALGYRMLEGSGLPLLDLAAEVAYSHHELWDGSGYPRGLRGTEIPVSGRIVAIADVIDALLAPRPYKAAWTLEEVLEYLRDGAGRRFDPHLVQVLLAHVPSVLAVWLSQLPTPAPAPVAVPVAEAAPLPAPVCAPVLAAVVGGM